MENNSKKFSNRDAIRERSEKDTERRLSELMDETTSQGYTIEFGSIGKKTTYCLLSKDDEEIVGYTFIKDIKYLNVKVGKLKALQQAIIRKDHLDPKNKEESSESK